MHGLKPNIWNQIFSCFEKYGHLEEVILYGSRAKGTYKHTSDIDLILKGEHLTTKNQLKLENDMDDLLLPWKFDVSLFRKINDDRATTPLALMDGGLAWLIYQNGRNRSIRFTK